MPQTSFFRAVLSRFRPQIKTYVRLPDAGGSRRRGNIFWTLTENKPKPKQKINLCLNLNLTAKAAYRPRELPTPKTPTLNSLKRGLPAPSKRCLTWQVMHQILMEMMHHFLTLVTQVWCTTRAISGVGLTNHLVSPLIPGIFLCVYGCQ